MVAAAAVVGGGAATVERKVDHHRTPAAHVVVGHAAAVPTATQRRIDPGPHTAVPAKVKLSHGAAIAPRRAHVRAAGDAPVSSAGVEGPKLEATTGALQAPSEDATPAGDATKGATPGAGSTTTSTGTATAGGPATTGPAHDDRRQRADDRDRHRHARRDDDHFGLRRGAGHRLGRHERAGKPAHHGLGPHRAGRVRAARGLSPQRTGPAKVAPIIERYLATLDHEELYVRRGPRTGLFCIVAVHSTVRGPSLGGCRMWTYDDNRAAIRDALRLSEGMTYKSAVAGLPLGGGKGVIVLQPGKPLDAKRRRAALMDFGETVERLGGSYITAEDVGTSTRAT